MFPAVVIDVPSDLAPAVAQTVVGRCEHVLGRGRCRLAPSGAEGAALDVRYYAFVRADDAASPSFEIEFRSGSATGELLARRRLAFSDRDPAESRWASAGLVVAGLVAAAELPKETPPAAQPKAANPPPPALAPVTDPPGSWGVDLGALTGPGLRRGPFRLGAFGRGWLGLPSAPELMAATTVRYAVVSDEPALQWLSVAAGMGARLGRRHAVVQAELIGELVIERLFITAVEAETGRTESGGQSRFGGRVGVNLALRATTHLRLLLGADAAAMTPPVKIEVNSVAVGYEPAGSFGFTAGLRFER